MMKKLLIGTVIIVIASILLVPKPVYYDDGGTVTYEAVLYSVTNYHSLKGINEYDTGIEIKIFGITVYENTTF